MQNPSLELPYHRDEQNSTVEVAHGWRYFASSGDPPQEQGQGPCELPEYKSLTRSQDPRRVYDGEAAQCWFIRWKVMDAGIFQRVPAERGALYSFDCMRQAWCSNSNDPEVSDGEMYTQVGIDPYGGTDPWSSSVEWSGWDWIGADYEKQSLEGVPAESDHITVYVRAWNKWRLSHNDVYIDDCHLTQEGGEPGPGPVNCQWDEERLREIVRQAVGEELDRRVWTPVVLNG